MNVPSYRQLRHLIDPRRPLTYGIVQAGDDFPGGVKYIRPVDMTDTKGVPDPDSLLRTSPEIARSYRRSTVAAEDVVLSIGPSYGKVMVVPHELDGCNLTQGTARIAPGPDLDARWLYWYLQSAPARDHWHQAVAGGTFSALNLGPLGSTPVPLLPLEEQRRIANYLDDQTTRIDQTIQLRQRQLHAVDEQRASLWEGKARDLASQYGTAPLRRFLLSITDGPFGSALKSSHYTDSGVRVVRLGNIGLAEFRPDDEAFIDPQYANELKEHEVVAGDMVVAGLGDERWPLGRATVVPHGIGPAIVKADCYRLRLTPVISHDFAAWYLSSPVGGVEIKLLARGSTRQRLNTDLVKDVPLAAPPLGVQVDVLREWEAKSRQAAASKQAIERSIELLVERRRSVVSHVVSGSR